MAIRVGDILGDYQVTGILGRGGMGKVFRVRSFLTEREEAMKIVLPDLDENPGLVDRFLREIKVHASLRHPNIAALQTALRIDGRLVMILELIEGVSLEEKIQLGPIDVPLAVGYMTQVLSALAFAHQQGVIHRDIKPANILIASNGMVKLTDFGIARSLGTERLTGAGLAVGTLAYMSPEQIRSQPVDARSDIYSLGLTFYEIVTGRRAVQADTEHGLLNAQLSAIPPDADQVNPRIPHTVSAAIMRAVAKEPGRRFQTAMEFDAALRDPGLNRTPVPAPAAASISTADLADLEARLSRSIGPIAKRLVTDAARRYSAISEIRQALAAQIEDPNERRKFLSTDTHPTVTMPAEQPVQRVSFDPATLERLTQALAPYLGPVAKVVVSRAARNARSAEELQNVLAGELPTEADRRRFLAAVR